jgi:hypothetical protein
MEKKSNKRKNTIFSNREICRLLNINYYQMQIKNLNEEEKDSIALLISEECSKLLQRECVLVKKALIA